MESGSSLQFYLLGPLLLCVVIFGILGNGISFVVLGRGQGDPSSILLLRALAIVDSLILLANSQRWASMFAQYNSQFQRSVRYLHWIDPYVFVYLNPVLGMLIQISAWLIVLVAGIRHSAVCFPLKAARLCSRTNVLKQILIVVTISVALCIPDFFKYKVSIVNKNMTDAANVSLEFTNIGHEYLNPNNTLELEIYEGIRVIVLTLCLPMVLVSIFNLRIIKKLRSTQVRTSHRPAGRDNVAMMMVVVIVVLVVCQMPITIVWFNFIMLLFQHDVLDGTTLGYLIYIGMFLQAVNSSVNFVIYSAVRPQFRKDLKGLCCRSSETNTPIALPLQDVKLL